MHPIVMIVSIVCISLFLLWLGIATVIAAKHAAEKEYLCPKCGKPLYRRYTREEKKIYCAIAPCDYEREYRPRGKARQTESGAPEEANL